MRLAALSLVSVLLLAGCFSEDAAPASPDANETPGASAAPAVDDGSAPMATDVGHMPHMHDYWMESERVTLFDDDLDPSQGEDPFQNLEPLLVDKQPKAGRMLWRLPDGKIVYEGTGSMEITASWDDPRVTSIAVEMRAPAATDFGEPVQLPQGELVPVAIAPDMTDMPHSKTSRWVFGFETADEPGAALGPFHLRIDIVRVADIMTFPGHPQLFEGKPEKVLDDADHEHTEVSYAKRVPQLATEGDFSEKTVSPSKAVPMETKAVRFELDILEATSTPGVVSEIRFFYHGADTTFLGHPTVLPVEGSLESKRLVYQVPVTMEQTDSPYANSSQWVMFVEPAVKLTGQEAEPTCGGCTDVSIKYHLKVIAYDHDLDDYSKMEGEE
ncbi:MAG TPA: hypothetical protein VM370_07070 [Candidatus Thermoplasmatota archaeon]|nr:hypothetical protein [Candidatus Thermoplasmatota archaeon]